MLVVADTSPLLYLVLIGRQAVLPQLFGAVSLPATVAAEMQHPNAPEVVRRWTAAPPPWLRLHPDPVQPRPELRRLDPGERAAIGLANQLGAGLLLLDDRAAVVAARQLGFRVTGTLGLLVEAARQGMLELAEAFDALRATSFRHAPALLDDLLAKHRRGE